MLCKITFISLIANRKIEPKTGIFVEEIIITSWLKLGGVPFDCPEVISKSFLNLVFDWLKDLNYF